GPPVAPSGCVIGTRAAHTRGGDRSADVRIPVTFATGGSDAGADPAASSGTEAGSGSGGGAAAEADPDGSLATTGVTVGIIAGAGAPRLGRGVAAPRTPRLHPS